MMKRRRTWGLGREDGGLRWVRTLVREVNELAARAEAIPALARGCQRTGHERITSLFARFQPLAEAKLPDGTPFKDLLAGTRRSLWSAGFGVFPVGHPIPHVVLAECDFFSARGLLLLRVLEGDAGRLRRFSPANGRLLTDNSGVTHVDGTCLAHRESSETEDRWWEAYSLYDAYTAVVHAQHYHTEKNGFFEDWLAAEALGLEAVGRVLRLKVFADYRHFKRADRRLARGESWVADAERQALGELPHAVLEGTAFLSEKAHAAVENLVERALLPALRSALIAPTPAGGALASRPLRSVALGLLTSGRTLEASAEVLGLQAAAACLEPRIVEVLATDTPARPTRRPAVRVDLADLDNSLSGQKRLLAAIGVQEPFYRFHDLRLAPLYEWAGKPRPNCPLPLPSENVFPVELRLKAAVFALVLHDVGPAMLHLPDHVFAFDETRFADEAQKTAFKSIFGALREVIGKRIQVEELLSRTPELQGSFDAWLTYYEHAFRYVGHGIDSAHHLVFPAVFFGDERFQALLAGESQDYSSAWMAMRNLLADLPNRVRARSWGGIRGMVQALFEALRRLHLSTVGGLVTPPPITQAALAPFGPPPVYFDERWLAVEDTAAPVRVVEPPPGDASKYGTLVSQNRRHIRRLQRLEADPLEETAQLRGHRNSGPLFDWGRMHLYPLGELLYSHVELVEEPAPGRKRQLSLLLDLSGSMDAARVAQAKRAGIILAEGLRARFELEFYTYNTVGSLYQMALVYDSRRRALAGASGLAAVTHKGFDAGSGWNPDAACLRALQQMLERRGEQEAVVVHISDHEWCKSMNRAELPTAAQEVEFAVRQLKKAGHRYVAARVAKPENPFAETGLGIDFLHWPEEIDDAKVAELHGIIARAVA